MTNKLEDKGLQAATRRKALAEAALAEAQAEEVRRSKRLGVALVRGISIIIPALAAAGTVAFSVAQLRSQTELSARTKTEDEIRRAEQIVANQWHALAAGTSGERRAALVFFEQWIPNQAPHAQARALATIGSIMAAEEDSEFRNALKAFLLMNIRNEYDSALHRSLADLLLAQNRALADSHSLILQPEQHQWVYDHKRASDVLYAIRDRAADTGDVISALVQAGFTADMSGIYCPRCNFRGVLHFDENTSFVGAVLHQADFSGAHLRGADFRGSDLRGARFVSANLQNSRFSSYKGDDHYSFSDPISQLVYSKPEIVDPAHTLDADLVHIGSPNFTCARLWSADFSGMPVFGVRSDSVTKKNLRLALEPTNFTCADVQDANLASAAIFGFALSKDDIFAYCGDFGMTEVFGAVRYFQLYAFDGCLDPKQSESSTQALKKYRASLSSYLLMTDWSEAEIPTPLRLLLNETEVQNVDCECAPVPELYE